MLDDTATKKKITKDRKTKLVINLTGKEIIEDFETCWISREASLLGRKEVLTGKAKFGILGDGKEVPQVAMARAFKKGDFRSGYYRDQTLMLALGISTVEDFFAQLYADTENDPFSGGRQMNCHYATQLIDEEGNWTSHVEEYNVSADISSTAGQMARSLGLALASKKYRANKELQETGFSNQGNEVCFCTIGDASTSEGIFWETVNAAGVMKVPLAISVWDDGYGISVPKKYQTTKESISKVLEGFKTDEKGRGIDIYTEKGWNYPALVQLYQQGIEKIRKTHTPALFHIQDLTQPQGHSTSGSHERYKSKERLEWEKENDCLLKMEEWMIAEGIITKKEANEIKAKAKKIVRESRNRAWKAFNQPTQKKLTELRAIFNQISSEDETVTKVKNNLGKLIHPLISDLMKIARQMQFALLGQQSEATEQLDHWIQNVESLAFKNYHTNLYSSSPRAAVNVPVIPPQIEQDAPLKNGYEILNAFFKTVFGKNPDLYAFGEDVGQIGDVNQGFAGLQKIFGKDRIFDTGIREWSIMGQAIGMAMRGLRPIAEIQYIDYLIYGLQPLTDDLATVRYRSNGLQQAPAIIRTRGHRLEGIWHAGSPLGMLIHALRGIYIMVPRNMTQAAGFYNTMLQSDDPGLIIECLNGYRLKERVPANLGEYTVPLGVPEILEEGTDLTLVTYGSCVRVAQEGIQLLKQKGISVELIDVQTLLPFDLEHQIVESLKKTNRILFMDEDVPGGATAFMMKEVLENQGGYRYLDSAPATLTAKQHRPPYGSDGDYFSKPNAEDVFATVYKIIKEAEPGRLN